MIGSVLGALVYVVDLALGFYVLVVIVSALISWVNPDPYNPVVRFLRAVTEPVFYRVRKALPFVMLGGFDLSPIVVIFAVYFIRELLRQLSVRVIAPMPF